MMPRRPIDRTGGTLGELHSRTVAQQLLTVQRDLDRVRSWLTLMPPDAALDVYFESNLEGCTLSFTRRRESPT